MALLGFLILFPLVVAAVLLVVRNNRARSAIVGASALVIGLASIWLVATYLGAPWVTFDFESPLIDYASTAVSVLVAAAILYYGIRYKNVLACVLAVIQVAGSLVFEFGFAHSIDVTEALYLDSLSLLMAFIIGVIGSGICVYALGYMEDFQAHEPEGAKDRRPVFFALMFVFLSAMFLIVFSNNMVWMFTGWEVTTVCSFLLIAYTRTEEAIKNAFRQIIMNLLGGLGFLAALYLSAIQLGTLSFLEFLQIGIQNPALVVLPVCALAFAGLTKAAQMPFHTWLLGAMVAPTPTSALLHSSTMVKAGVFLLVKLAPVFLVCPVPSVMVVLVGGITFALCSFMAISQSNAKRVLAYSTIANLGLITACAGVGTPEAVWAAAFLILFHAIAKSLLFLCVGTAEHHIGSRDIEDMDLLFDRMPRLARFMMLGIMCMFIAPFGMLVAKWATLVSFVDTGQVALILLLAFGSAATFMFWAKWLGKLSGIAGQPANVEVTVHKSEWTAIVVMAVLVVVGCVCLPIISQLVVEPYVYSVFGVLGQGIASTNLWIASIAAALIAIVAPVLGCLLAGLDRKITARMQGRVGPPLLQPYYDVRKLIEKDNVSVNSSEGTYITCALVFTLLAGGIFYSGGNLLMSVFVITLAGLFFIVAAYSTRSPYAELGANRETLQVMSYEPMVLFMAVAFYMAAGTFDSAGVFALDAPVVTSIWLVFLGLLFVLTIKLRKSPFDLSYSHHAHQELVKGITTEMSGKTLAKVEIMHWCENVLFLGWVGLFFVWANPLSIVLAIVVVVLVYFLEIWIDNNFARVKWQAMLSSAWAVAFVAGFVNIAVLAYL